MAKVRYIQPFPFEHYDLEEQDFVPCGIISDKRYVQGTRKEMMALFWKAKIFEITGSYTNYLFNDPNNPAENSYFGEVKSSAVTETDLVCNPGYDITASVSGSGILDVQINLEFTGTDFYYNTIIDPEEDIVKLYGNFDIQTDSDDYTNINTGFDGPTALTPFLIGDFQVYYSGLTIYYTRSSPPNFSVGPIDNFSASITAVSFWEYLDT